MKGVKNLTALRPWAASRLTPHASRLSRASAMSFTLHGIPVSGGIAIGHAHLVSHARLEVAHYVVPQAQIAEELTRFDAALTTVRAELEELRTQIPANAPQEFDAFLNLHLMILNDTTLSKAPREIIAAVGISGTRLDKALLVLATNWPVPETTIASFN